MGECKDFNDFLYDLREAFDGCPRRGWGGGHCWFNKKKIGHKWKWGSDNCRGFWDMVKQGNVSVITVSEVASSEYPDEKAAKVAGGMDLPFRALSYAKSLASFQFLINPSPPSVPWRRGWSCGCSTSQWQWWWGWRRHWLDCLGVLFIMLTDPFFCSSFN